MKKLPILGAGVQGDNRTLTSQRRLNCYLDIRPDEDKTKVAVIGTPGLTQVGFTGTGPSRVIYAGTNVCYSVTGTSFTAFTLDPPASVTAGVFGNVTTPISMSDNSIEMVAVDGANMYVFTYNALSTSHVKVLSAGFPYGAKTIAFLGGYFIVEHRGTNQFNISGSYNAISWNALDFASAEQTPDFVDAVDVDHGLLILFGLKHIEFWYLSGGLDFPFSPIQSATQEYGLAATFSRAHVANTIAFLARNPQGTVQVRWFQGYNAQVISTPDIDQIINGFDTVDDAEALSYVVNGHEMYQLTFPTENRSFLFDCTTQIWSEAQTGTDLVGRHVGRFSALFQGQTLITDYANGNTYAVDPLAYTDNGATIKRLLQTRHTIEDGNVIGIDEIYLDMETGVGLDTGQGSDPQIMLQVSKDGGRTWGAERWVSFGMGGQYLGPRATWRRIGSARDLTLRFALTDPVKFVVNYGAATLRERPQ